MSRVEDEVRVRLAEMLGSAGVPSSQISLQVLYLLPPDFVDAYQALFHKALKGADVGGVGGDGREALEKASGRRKAKTAEGKTLGQMRGARGGRAHKRAWTVADEQALGKKQLIDKKLRKLAREIRGLLAAEMGEKLEVDGLGLGEDKIARCSGKRCGKFVEGSWKYCPFCGTRRRAEKEAGATEKTGKAG
jgi:hypothetical protein